MRDWSDMGASVVSAGRGPGRGDHVVTPARLHRLRPGRYLLCFRGAFFTTMDFVAEVPAL